MLTIPQSVRVGKLWFSLLELNGANVQWNYWTIHNDELTRLCQDLNLEDLIDWHPPFTRTTGNLKVLLKAVVSYLSRGNFEVLLDQWLTLPVVPVNPEDAVGGGLDIVRNALIDQTPNCEDSSVTAMITRSKEILLTIEYQEQKYLLGETFANKFNTYNERRMEAVGIENRVIRQEVTKANALTELDSVLEAQEEAFNSLRSFFMKEPGEGAYNGCVTLLGDVFNPGVNMPELLELVREASNEEIGVIMRVNQHIHSMVDVPDMQGQYNDLLREYQLINQQRVEREDQAREVARRTKNFMTELLALKKEIDTTPEEDLGVSVVKDYLEQVSDLKKKVGTIRALDDKEIPTGIVRVTEIDVDNVGFNVNYTVDEWMANIRRNLLLMKDNQETQRRKLENKEKVVLQETLKSLP